MSDFSPAEATQLVETFKALDVKPKADTPEDLQAWMLNYLTSQGKVPKQEQGAKILPGFPRIATFSGDPAAKGDTTFDLWKYEKMI